MHFRPDPRGDFFNTELETALERWHPYDPNRIVGWPVSGYGWPSDEYLVRIKAQLRGAKPRTKESFA